MIEDNPWLPQDELVKVNLRSIIDWGCVHHKVAADVANVRLDCCRDTSDSHDS